jgi:putative transposase
MRDECLNEHLFFSINHARTVVAGWVEDFNTARPHSAIGYITPAAYAASLNPQRAPALRHPESSAPMPVATVALTRNSQPRIPVTPG